jgi:hypothetical protein
VPSLSVSLLVTSISTLLSSFTDAVSSFATGDVLLTTVTDNVVQGVFDSSPEVLPLPLTRLPQINSVLAPSVLGDVHLNAHSVLPELADLAVV